MSSPASRPFPRRRNKLWRGHETLTRQIKWFPVQLLFAGWLLGRAVAGRLFAKLELSLIRAEETALRRSPHCELFYILKDRILPDRGAAPKKSQLNGYIRARPLA